MKIVKLVAENVKRLHAISITPEGTLVTIAGKNGAGKSSVLDSIAYAMGGEKLVPSEPIRNGEAEAKIVVDLGDLIVTRRFVRDKVHMPSCAWLTSNGHTKLEDGAPVKMPCDCTPSWSETRSTLSVTNKDGARYPSPQAVLDKLLGKLTFDALEFARADVKTQDAILRKLVNVDVTLLEGQRRQAFDQRAMVKKSYAIKEAQIMALPQHADAPTAEVSLQAISDELKRADELRTLADEAEKSAGYVQSALGNASHARETTRAAILDIEKRLTELKRMQLEQENTRQKLEAELNAATDSAKHARGAVPDVAVLRDKLTAAEQTNAKVRANAKRAEVMAEAEALLREIETLHQAVITAEEAKKSMLASAKFPVAGLGLSDDGVTFNALPFTQAGSAEQVRVSVAIGIALNPTLKVLLIRNGNLLDGDSLKAVAAQAEAADVQVWMEYVSDSKDGVAVMMVDGEVA